MPEKFVGAGKAAMIRVAEEGKAGSLSLSSRRHPAVATSGPRDSGRWGTRPQPVVGTCSLPIVTARGLPLPIGREIASRNAATGYGSYAAPPRAADGQPQV